jgi:FMN-dependent NADH-azoreductase
MNTSSMKLSIINGSPRGKSSNTKILLDKFLEGFCSVESDCKPEIAYLKSAKHKSGLIQIMETSDILIIAFPLYTDAMPGIVKEFIEQIDPATFKNKGLKLGFIVQSGFPESHHSEFIKRYLDKLARRIGIDYLGTVIKGGVEGIKVQPKWMTRRYLDLFYDLGQQLALDWTFSQEIIKRLAKPKQMSGLRLMTFKLVLKLGLGNFYWDMQLKNNNAFDQRFAKPYYK